MKLMFPRSYFVGVFLPIFALILAFGATASAQKKGSAAKKAVAKKVERSAKDAKKAKTTAKNDRHGAKETARNDRKGTKDRNKERQLTAREKREAAKKDKVADNKKSKSDRRRDEAERRRKEAERRAAILEEKRRREAAIREARARALAFERGLHTETQANIAKDVTDGEDLKIRSAAIRALGDHAGSVVVMEAQTGKVLTIVNQDWAVRSTIRPCSTVKLVTGTAALNEGVINKEDGSIRNTPTRRNLDDAVAFSDNGYFQRAGSQVGTSKFAEYGRKLGLGEPTGVNLVGEAPGRVPVTNSNPRIYSHGDDTEVSTIQLAVLASEITNGGHRVLPRIPRNDVEKTKFQTFYKADVNVPQQNIRRLIPGMMGAAEYGTARRGMDQNLGVAGKTGSCIDKGSWVGLFASVAPIEQPKYAVAVITRGPKERGRVAAGIAAQIYSSLANTIVRTDRNLAQTEFHLKPRTGAALSTAAVAAADDEGDDEADGTSASPTTGNGVIVVPVVPKADANKLITRTGNSQPVNQPIQQPAAAPSKPASTQPNAKPNTSKPGFSPVVITYDKSGADKPVQGDKGKGSAPVKKP